MMTAGIAATRPIAVASSASAMPGATTARLVVCDFEMPIKLFMMPHTVPNSPTNGDVAPMVASTPMPSRIRRASARTISAKLEAARSLMPASLEIPADSLPARIADLLERSAQFALHDRQLDHLGDENGPGHQRGEGQPDHHGLDQDV